MGKRLDRETKMWYNRQFIDRTQDDDRIADQNILRLDAARFDALFQMIDEMGKSQLTRIQKYHYNIKLVIH